MAEKLYSYVLGDPEKCVGCKACELACFAEHNRNENRVGKTVGTVTIPVTPKLFVTRTGEICMPIQCHHCEDAPCLKSCTIGAIRRTEQGIILDEKQCTGCKDCIQACPFGSIAMMPVSMKGKPVLLQDTGLVRKAALKCDLCVGNEKGPACVRACPHDALRMVDAEEEAEKKRIRAAEILADL